ncbi:MAG: hypothetical protein RIQ89_165, partial [Bacteroidota bacterium]
MKNQITQLRLWAAVEGVSFLILLFVAMPIKYLLNNPQWVKIIG